MATDASWELQKALKASLAGYSTLTALLADGANSILDDVPGEELLPYVTVGDIASDENETMINLGQVHTVTINAWAARTSRAGGTIGHEGRKKAREIISAVIDRLNHASLSMTGFAAINVIYQLSQVFREDADTYHGIARFRIVTEPV
jgi:hypothetical protein